MGQEESGEHYDPNQNLSEEEVEEEVKRPNTPKKNKFGSPMKKFT